MKLLFVAFIILVLSPYNFHAQDRTVGLLSYDEEKAFDGYNLIFPHFQSDVYLINNCGEIVHTWEGNPEYQPGNSVYLLEDGTLIRCSRYFNSTADTIWAGGGGELVEALDWDGNILWSFSQNDTLKRLHHDIEILPNGNVLMISWEKKTKVESIQEGRDPDNIGLGKLWPDYVLEYNPVLDSVVWEWHTWDHLVQDFDETKDNYGSIADNPGKIDINYETNMGLADWHHMNAIDYNPELDQIILSVPHFNEVWIIDHSTTAEEAASNSGGNSGKGGQLLYRWGNPLAYQSGEQLDQKLFFQHDIQWINSFIDENDELYNKLMVFNNRVASDFSTVNIFEPVLEDDGFNYVMEGGVYLPNSFSDTIMHPIPQQLFSTGLSSTQYLPNGNFLIFSGRFGYGFELTPGNEVVWEYKVPLNGGVRVSQGDVLTINNNLTFRMNRFPLDFPAFEGKDLSPKGLLQLNDDEDFCAQLVATVDLEEFANFEIYPNPVSNTLIIKNVDKPGSVYLFDLNGVMIKSWSVNTGDNNINLDGINAGIYLIKTGNQQSKKLIKIH